MSEGARRAGYRLVSSRRRWRDAAIGDGTPECFRKFPQDPSSLGGRPPHVDGFALHETDPERGRHALVLKNIQEQGRQKCRN